MRKPDSSSRKASEASILVVEDDENLRLLLCRMLKRAGFHAEGAVDGVDALICFRNGSFDLVITDLIMPNMDGFDLIRTLLQSHLGLRIIAISGVEERIDYLDMAMKLGAVAKHEKPMSSAELVGLVRRVLGVDVLALA
jgi:two-component system, chemotaxis family, chemotaxis protein CheY